MLYVWLRSVTVCSCRVIPALHRGLLPRFCSCFVLKITGSSHVPPPFYQSWNLSALENLTSPGLEPHGLWAGSLKLYSLGYPGWLDFKVIFWTSRRLTIFIILDTISFLYILQNCTETYMPASHSARVSVWKYWVRSQTRTSRSLCVGRKLFT